MKLSLIKSYFLAIVALAVPAVPSAFATTNERCLYYARLASSDRTLDPQIFGQLENITRNQRAALAPFDRSLGVLENMRDPRFRLPTLLMVREMDRVLRAQGFGTVISELNSTYVLRITSVPEGFWLRRVLDGVNRADDSRGALLNLVYTPLYDLRGTPQGSYNFKTRTVIINARYLREALEEGRSDVLLHEITHDYIERLTAMLRVLPPPGQTRGPVSPYVGRLIPTAEMAAAFPAYEKIFSFDELLTHRRMIQQMLAGRRQAQELIDLGQADILAMIPRLRNRLSAEERASLLKFGTRLLTLANSLDVSLGRWERMIELNPRRIVWDSITRNDDQTIDRVFLRLPDGNVMYLPVPEEISSELDLQRYIFDQLRRLREQAQRDRELGAEVVRTISNR